MSIPHKFPSLVDGPKQVVLIAGAGLSTDIVPGLNELKGKLDEAAESKGVSVPIAPADDAYFYALAEALIEKLKTEGETEDESRLWLAEKLGLLSDRRWFGEAGLPLSGNTPRHRAIARFAVENRLRAIVSLNWDTLLEASLDSVGLADSARSPRPWEITAHCSVIDDTHLPCLGNEHVFPVIKPHGCVRNLEHARRQFCSTGATPVITLKVTKSELDNLPAGQTHVDKKVEGYVTECPLIAVGWKATEGYLRNTVINTAKTGNHTESDAFTLVSRSWYQNHDKIVTAYNKTKQEAFAAVSNPGQRTLDCLFQWLQARYALRKLIAVATAPLQQAALQQLFQQLDQPVHDHFILRWADGWLPTWVRLCWRAGAMQGFNPRTNKKIDPGDIPVIPRDVHVPLAGMALKRRELQAAARLLAVLGGDLSRFNFEKFPGGFWNNENRSLYIPLPGWRGTTAQSADLAALGPLIEALRGLGFVQKIYLVWLDTEPTPFNQSYRNQLAAQVSRLMPLATFATVDALAWVDLEMLKGDAYETAA